MPHDAHLYKMTGSGNDFVFLDGRAAAPAEWPADRIAAVCDRRIGVGADGLVFVTPEGDSVRMIYYNADGGRADMCGNAALCSTRFAARLGLAQPDRMELLTDAGTVVSRCVGPDDRAEIGLPSVALPVEVPGIERVPGEQWIRFATVGVPHLVVLVDDITAVDVQTRGRELRYHLALGPAGANTNFVARPPAGSPWPIRTYERGVEGETLACGTGTVAAAIALMQAGLAASPADFESWAGFPLRVQAELGAEATGLRLEGQGRLVFEADLR